MEAAVIDKIVSLRDDSYIKEIDGIVYSARALSPVMFEPRASALDLNTLSGLVEYIASAVDEINPKEHIIQVEDYRIVNLISKLFGNDRKREIKASAILDKNLKEFPFGEFQSTESFIIRLRTMFCPSNDLDRVLSYVSKLKSGTEINALDDGITQTATIKKGVSGALSEDAIAPMIVSLLPYRTFREISQPSSDFLFRITLQNDVPKCGLFEADGGAWRLSAVGLIASYLKDAKTGITVIA